MKVIYSVNACVFTPNTASHTYVSSLFTERRVAASYSLPDSCIPMNIVSMLSRSTQNKAPGSFVLVWVYLRISLGVYKNISPSSRIYNSSLCEQKRNVSMRCCACVRVCMCRRYLHIYRLCLRPLVSYVHEANNTNTGNTSSRDNV